LTRSLSNAVRIHRAEVQAAEANQKLKESEERYRLVLEGSNDGVWDWYICLNEIYCNDRLFEILGIVREEFGTAYDAFYRLIHPDDRLRVLRAITAHLEQGENFDVEFRLLHSSAITATAPPGAKPSATSAATCFGCRALSLISPIANEQKLKSQR
jgi:PAS domain-containing protein